MDNSLPDEIISLILTQSPALKIPDEAFADNWSTVSPFAQYSESTSAYLLVCKSWLRVATPLLYGVVVLRSSAQAKALARALKGNPELGRFVKKLRVEGGLGSALQTVLELAPNITDLFLTLEIYGTDKTDGLCKGLPLISPRRLILQRTNLKQKPNKQLDALMSTLQKVFKQWDQLVELGVPFHRYSWKQCERTQRLVESLDGLKRIEVVTIPFCHPPSIIRVGHWLRSCPLRELHVSSPIHPSTRETVDAQIGGTLEKIIRYKLKSDDSAQEMAAPAPSLDPFFSPLANVAADTSDRIWSHILGFAIPPRVQNSASGPQAPGYKRITILLVCKKFYRLGFPHFYSSVVFKAPDHPIQLANTLAAHPTLCAHVTTVGGELFYRTEWSTTLSKHIPVPSRQQILSAISTALSSTINLSVIHLPPSEPFLDGTELILDWATFASIVASVGPSLTELFIPLRDATAAQDATVVWRLFSRLTALRKLHWKSDMVVNFDGVPEGTLFPRLVHLEVDVASLSFFKLLALAKPPLLRHLSLFESDSHAMASVCEELLRTQQIAELDIAISTVRNLSCYLLDLCPSLVSLQIICPIYPGEEDIPNEEILACDAVAGSLETICFHCVGFFIGEKGSKLASRVAQYLSSISFERMPKVKEIRVDGLRWPTTERDIAKSPWVRASDALAKSDVSLVDSSGKKWRSRLKLRGGKV
ncbi:hypothetical protein HMN09_01350900 [Mycena chlorophos]|uniref:Uncharacterized protein n=1 Tax=Mycena chlorophos TaxID=658473 RepID=A0A8H6S0H2_MYCCL|nr:hypothetical protein HMN09_01350900 [Mycena chlorophos]